MPEDPFHQFVQRVEIFGWIRNIEVKPYHHNEINTSENENRTCEIGFLRNLNVFCSNHDLRFGGLRNDSMAFQCKQLSILEGILKFAVRNCEKRRLIFAVLPDIDLAKIILFSLFVFSLG